MILRKYFLLFLVFLSYIPVLAQVDTAWVRRYNGPGNGSDYAFALAVDTAGNVYVTGYSYGGGTFADYATIKYAPNGDTLWVRRYNGPGNDDDYAFALAVDDSGNVYVTGQSRGSVTFLDYATIKYATNGDTLWVRRYNGPGNDVAYALAVDDSGNVYVTGSSGSDYTTIKYTPNGDTLWVRRYNGPANEEDAANNVRVGASGNVYVTGYSYNLYGGSYATIKYAANGDTLWARRYQGPGNFYDVAYALAVDEKENVYVTGLSWGNGTDEDYATIKYAPNGDTLWVRRYNGPNDSRDVAISLAVDDSGNVYVAGMSDSTYVSDYATIKYNTNGDILWVRRYNGPDNDEDRASALKLDKSQNVYVTGVSKGNLSDEDYVTIKYAPNGDTLWVRRYNGPGNGSDYAFALAVDTAGNVYVTGQSYGSGTYDDYATIKYNKFGCAARAGDANGDININLDDIIFEVNSIFKGGPKPDPFCAGDINADGKILLTDIVYMVNFVFKSGPAPIKSRECCL